MIPEWIVKWIGGGFLVAIAYVVVSNTLWLIFGAKLLQSLPGVNINGARGTAKIIMMIVMSAIGVLLWLLLFVPRLLRIIKWKTFLDELSGSIQIGGKVFYKIFPNM